MAKARQFRLFGRDIVIGKRLFGLGRDDSFGIAGMSGVGGADIAELDTYNSVVYACINLIAESVASYQPVIMRKNGDQWKDIGEDHELLKLLRRPSGRGDKAVNVTMFDLLYATASFIELQGDCYWYIGKGLTSGLPREITILRADRVGQDINKDTGDIDRYYVKQMGGGKTYIPIDEMLPFIGFNPKDPYHGTSTVAAAREYIATDQLTNIFTKNFFKNNAGVSGVLSIKGEVTKPAFKKLVRAFRSKYEGVDNAGKVMIVRGDEAKLTKFGLGLDELDMPVLRKMSRDDIAMMFRVPMPLLGKAEESGLGRANVETLEYIFAKYNIEPKLKKLDAVLQIMLERYYQSGQTLRIAHKNIIPEDKEYNLNRLDKLVDRTIKRNEARDAEGLDSVDGGDELFVPMSAIPISDAGATAPADSAGKGITIKIRRKVTTGKAAVSGDPLGLDSNDKRRKPTPNYGKDLDISPEKKEHFRLRLMKNQTTYERRYRAAVRPIIKDQKAEALKNLEAHASSIAETKAFEQKLFDDAAADALMKDALNPVLKNLATQQGGLALVFAGDDKSEFKITSTLEKILEARTAKMASAFNDETLAFLNATLAEGIQAGENLELLKERVAEVYKGADGYRVERIARTETLNASNEATNTAYKQTGYVTGKQWYANPDADAECEAMDGKSIGLDDTFIKQGESYTFTNAAGEEESKTNTYDDVDSPPLHPNCRCTIIPVKE